ncbi:MAG: MATE family efflux transporter [Oscillospiraceae bacterium]|nr:MATE family efflux transporter [Oscillospiraceae bacterium]
MQEVRKENPLGTERMGRLIMRYSTPAIASILVHALYNITDQIFIGRGFFGYEGLGVPGIAATNVAFPLVIFSMALSLLIGVGTSVTFNLKLGAGDREAAAKAAGNGLNMAVFFGLLLGGAALILGDRLLDFFGTTDEIYPYVAPYMKIICFSIPIQVFVTAASKLIRADGSPTFSMVCIMSGAVVNIILDPILIYVFGMGMAGAGFATLIGLCFSAFLSAYYVLRKFKCVRLDVGCYRPNSVIIKRICALGVTACVNQLALAVVQITMNNTLRYYGANSIYGSEIPLACVGAISKINVVFLAFVIGIAQGCQPIHSFNYGAKKYERVKTAYIAALISSTVFSTLIFIVFQLFPRPVMSIFGQGSEEYFLFSERYLRIFMFFIFLNGIQPVTANFFNSIGKAKVGITLSLTRQIAFLVPLLLLLPRFFGIDGVVYAGPISDGAAFLLAGFFIIREIKELNRLIYSRS